MKKITLETILNGKRNLSYVEQYRYVCDLIDGGKIVPIKSSGYNGKTPLLPLAFRIIDEKKDYSELIEELKYGVSTQISIDYYLKHPDIYEMERKWVLSLSRYLEEADDNKLDRISLNERSFQIWNREKFIQKESGNRILNHCGITLEQLNLYHTSEPLSYYSSNRDTPQSILIVENKDTFYSMRKYMIEHDMKSESCSIFGIPIRTIVYGAGKGILRSVEDFTFCVEPYMNYQNNEYLYFGDLDYEGIGIYEQLAESFQSVHILIPFVEAYAMMLDKTERCEELPDTKEGQNKNISGRFYSYFDEGQQSRIQSILKKGKYIPQEILNITDFS